MRIGHNLLFMIPGVVGGTQTYALSLIRALAAADERNEYVVYVNRESAGIDITDAPNFRIVQCDVRASSRPKRYAYEQGVLPVKVRRDRIDVLHSMGYVGPLFSPCPHVVTVHDLIYEGYREFMDVRRRRWLRFFVRRSVERATEVVTVSESAKREIVDDIGVDASKVTVVHGAGRDTTNALARSPLEVITRSCIRQPYVAAFGSMNPGKNIGRLVEAFAASRHRDVTLVVIGHLSPLSGLDADLDRLGLRGRVVTTGFVPDDDVLPLIAGASAFAYPSVYEGFGLPVLDAQEMGVPVICSHAASLPEVAGDGALFFDPYNVGEITAILERVLDDAELRNDLIARGTANVARFSWSRAADETLQVYARAVARA
jgi:glycosyltransferase involved in cell wall biosynthesis